MEQEIIKSIKNLPMIPDSIHKIQQICSDANSSIADVIKIVEKDPILTANLLRAANSPLYGFSREVTNIAQAVSLFGMSTIKGFAIVTAVKSRVKINLSPYSLSEQSFLRTADLQNAFMVRWVSRLDKSSLSLLSPASFLLEIGVVILSSVLLEHEKQNEFMEALNDRGKESVSDIEREILGMSSYQAASALFEYWNFDKSLVDIMEYVENPQGAPQDLITYAYMLSILHHLISLYNVCTENQIQSAKKILECSPINEYQHFEKVLKEFLLSIQ